MKFFTTRCLAAAAFLCGSGALAAPPKASVIIGPQSPSLEAFAARELCGYLDRLFGIQVSPSQQPSPGTEVVFFVGSPKTNPAIARVLGSSSFPSLSDQGIVLRRVRPAGRDGLIVGGGSARATLWAVYDLVERWGVRYLVDRDVLPAKPVVFRLPEDAVLEPAFRIRAHPTIQDLVASGEAWGFADFRPLMDQLAKMKFTRMNIYTFGWQPHLHWEYKGIARRSATLWYGYHYPITPYTIGRELFGDATEFWNPDLPLTSNYRDLVKAGERLIHRLIDHAHQRGLECAVYAPLTDFPPEFAPLLKGAEQSSQLAGMTIVPGQETPVDDPNLFGLSRAVLGAVLKTYPEADVISIGMPEFRQWVGEYERAWQALDSKYKLSEIRALPDMLSSARNRKGAETGSERGVRELQGDITNLYFYDRLLRDPRLLQEASRAELTMSVFGVSEELFPVLDRVWPGSWELESMPSNQPVNLLKRIEILSDLPARIAGNLNLTLDDDNIGILPQMNTQSLSKILGVMRRTGWRGFTARERFPGDHDWTLAYIARAAWRPEVEPDAVGLDLLAAVCGKACATELLAAFHHVETVTIALAPTAFAFPADWPPPTPSSPGGMLMKHWSWKPGQETPSYLEEAYQGYAKALQAAERAEAQASEQGRSYAAFWVGRLRFALQYVDAVRNVRQGAARYVWGDRTAAVKHADDALTALRQGLEAYARVARTQSDRAAIALANDSYRQLFQRRWSVKTWGY